MRGIRLHKHGRRGRAERTFRLDVSVPTRPRLVWPKSGLKMGNRGTFELAHMTSVVAALPATDPMAHASVESRSLQLQLQAGMTSLTLEARSTEEHRALGMVL